MDCDNTTPLSETKTPYTTLHLEEQQQITNAIAQFYKVWEQISLPLQSATNQQTQLLGQLFNVITDNLPTTHHQHVAYRFIMFKRYETNVPNQYCTFENAMKVVQFENTMLLIQNKNPNNYIKQRHFAELHLRGIVNLAWKLHHINPNNCTTSITNAACLPLFGLHGYRHNENIPVGYKPRFTTFSELFNVVGMLKTALGPGRVTCPMMMKWLRKQYPLEYPSEEIGEEEREGEGNPDSHQEEMPNYDNVNKVMQSAYALISQPSQGEQQGQINNPPPPPPINQQLPEHPEEMNDPPPLPTLPDHLFKSLSSDRDAILKDFAEKCPELVGKVGGLTLESFITGNHQLDSIKLVQTGTSYSVAMKREDRNELYNSPYFLATLCVAINE